jgi:hypothetical protein
VKFLTTGCAAPHPRTRGIRYGRAAPCPSPVSLATPARSPGLKRKATRAGFQSATAKLQRKKQKKGEVTKAGLSSISDDEEDEEDGVRETTPCVDTQRAHIHTPAYIVSQPSGHTPYSIGCQLRPLNVATPQPTSAAAHLV